MSSTELVVKAGRANADLLNFGSVTGWWIFQAASVFITAWMGDVQYHSCGRFHLCLLFVIATLSKYPEADDNSHAPSVRSLSLPVKKVITS